MTLNEGLVSIGDPVKVPRICMLALAWQHYNYPRVVDISPWKGSVPTIFHQFHDKYDNLRQCQGPGHPRRLLPEETLLIPIISSSPVLQGPWRGRRALCLLVHPFRVIPKLRLGLQGDILCIVVAISDPPSGRVCSAI